jgi:hypothetical protein
MGVLCFGGGERNADQTDRTDKSWVAGVVVKVRFGLVENGV